MATEVKLPRLGQGMESGVIVRWLKAEGETVEKGDVLYELETEKVTQEVEAEASGILLKIALAEGEAAVGTTVAVIGQEGEEVSVAVPAAQVVEAAAEASPPGPARADGRREGQDAAGTQTNGRIKASPLARRIARELGVDLAALSGTGPEGRIVAEDVERAASAPAAPAFAAAAPGVVEVVELTSLRKTIARRLTEAWEAPVFQISMSADMTRALALRRRLVELTPDGGVKPTVSDVLTKIAALALVRHRGVNATFEGDAIHLHPAANVGLAVATDRGLLVPVIPAAERLSIPQIGEHRAELVERARSGKLQQADLDGGTFTISNLGMYGVEQFVAVLNPPQAAILAVGAAADRPVAVDGEVVVRPLMTLTLACDHRAIDGDVAADFLRTVKTFLEEPGLGL